ncbi:MAG: hypothetical protein KIT84_17920 [Labilithrix sp.]|nr:hypothetical protein [Labilithrix sp.]
MSMFGTWSLPADGAAKLALALALVVGVLAWRWPSLLLVEGSRRRFLAIASVAAGVLSVAYVSLYLRGGPRIVDATTYWLQGRALSHGDLAWTPLDPTASFRGRFLLYREGSLGGSLGGIFPPGYPLLLAAGFLLGAPMVIGPALAAALVVATYRLALAMCKTGAEDRAISGEDERVARAAALLSVACAALRYHTADTMSHGATALGVAIALEAALRGRATIAWLAVGYVAATRPVSALPIGAVVAALVLRKDRLRSLLGLAPGVLLLLASQRAVTGSWLASSQRMYYALSDGPEGCFRWGFGAGTGCLFEHGDFVRTRLPHGYGIVEALGTTARRLHHHLLDVASFEPLALLVLVPALKKHRAAYAASALVGLHVLAYAPFYFDGDYPGGGARFFADVLPIEHALVAVGVALLARAAKERALHAVLALSLLGFAVHAVHLHRELRDRDGGRPMFEPDVLAQASLKQGLVFVDTDHGFALGHDPARTPADGIVVARRREDDRDRLLFERLDRPPTYWYRLEPSGPVLTPWAPPELGPVLRFEAEAEWPVRSQSGGFAVPAWTHACASGRRALVLTPADGTIPATATFEIPVPEAGTYELSLQVSAGRTPGATTIKEGPARGGLSIAEERIDWVNPETCATVEPRTVTLEPPRVVVTFEATGGPIGLDAVRLRSLGSR